MKSIRFSGVAGFAVVACAASSVHAQGVVGDLLAGKLVDPKVGQWAWYDVLAKDGSKQYVLRQAIVGEEKVGRKYGFWVEFEVVPEVGYRSVYKMLLTGPAGEPDNVHRVIEQSGIDPPRELPIPEQNAAPGESRPKRTSLGADTVKTLDGKVRAEHYEIVDGDKSTHLWINERIYPMGIVRLESDSGVMVLRNHGAGGQYARSVITSPAAPPADEAPAVPPVEVETSVGDSNPDKSAEKKEGP